jgi:hypothetical protein
LAGHAVAGGRGILVAYTLAMASVGVRTCAGAISAAGRPAGGFECVAAGTPTCGRTACLASYADGHAGQGVARVAHSDGGSGDRISRDTIADDELGLHDLAGAADHDQSNVAEIRVADASLECRSRGRLVRVDRLDYLVHQLVRRVDQIDRRTAARDGLGQVGPGRSASSGRQGRCRGGRQG